MFLVITVIIFILGVLLCLIKGKEFDYCRPGIFKNILKILSNSDFNGYLVNTMIAFLGITTAITFTNFNTVKQEERWTVEFMEDVLLTELDTKITLMNEAVSGMHMDSGADDAEETEKLEDGEISIDVGEPSNPEKIFETMKVYPISPVSSLDMLLMDSPYKYTISRHSYSALIDCRMNFIAQKAAIDNSRSIREMAEHLSKMSYHFERAYKIIEIELRYQNHEISEDDVYEEIDRLYDELRKSEDSIVAG